jgi:capsular exopolysaccharide synthesis family protein
MLIIDADMRKPVQHVLVRLDNKTGLSSVLGGIVHNVSKVIKKNVRLNLDVLTSGSVPPNPAELISSEKMDQLLELVGSHYDYVFIDTPPANVVTDAFLFNGKTAGIVCVVREGMTTHADIKEVIEKAKMTNGHILGFIKAYCSAKGKGGYKSYRYKYEYENK